MDVSSLVFFLCAWCSESLRKSSGRGAGQITWKLSDNYAEKWHTLRDTAGTPSLWPKYQTVPCHLKDEILEVSLWAEGQRAVQRLLGICLNCYLHIDHVTLVGTTSGGFPLLASRESNWLSEVPYILSVLPEP